MRRTACALALLLLAQGRPVGADPLRMVVADAPYPRVWAAAQEALSAYPIERLGDGEIVTGWRDRPARAEEEGFQRITERMTLRVEAFAERITRITVIVELRGWRDGASVTISDTEPAARDVLERVRAALR